MGKLLVVGSVALDTVKTPFGEVSEVLGGSATYFSTAASYFTSVDLIAVDRALEKLQNLSERQARIVELRCLLGLTVEETADALDVSERTVHAEWRLARAWLTRELEAEPDAG